MESNISPKTLKIIEAMQQGEVTESLVYAGIAKHCKDPANKAILEKIASDEARHGKLWQKYTGKTVKPNKRRAHWFIFLSRLLGFTFAIRRMENGEDAAQDIYREVAKEIPEAIQIESDEKKHEEELISMLDEERLRFVGAVVLGLNDALVELTGALAGFTMAYGQNIKLIAFSGLITGLAAALSMAASAYLSASADNDKDSKKSAVYTGVAYLITVMLLVAPYLIFGYLNVPNGKWYALAIMLSIVILIIAGFNYYISVAKRLKFRRRFLEMFFISLGVTAISFLIGLLVNKVFGITI